MSRSFRLGDAWSLGLQIEASNVFRDAQFYGPALVDGEVNNANF